MEANKTFSVLLTPEESYIEDLREKHNKIANHVSLFILISIIIGIGALVMNEIRWLNLLLIGILCITALMAVILFKRKKEVKKQLDTATSKL